VGHVAWMVETRNLCDILIGKPYGKRQLGRLRQRWEDSTEMDLREIRWDSVD